ncbi:MAG: helix-turn-helix transcriptional regulator [Sedimenticola sp.]
MTGLDDRIVLLLEDLYPTALSEEAISHTIGEKEATTAMECERLAENGSLNKTKDGKYRWNGGNDTLAYRLRKLRLEMGITQKQLGELCYESQSLIHKVESGQILRPRSIEAIAIALNVNPAWLQFGDRWAVQKRPEKKELALNRK